MEPNKDYAKVSEKVDATAIELIQLFKRNKLDLPDAIYTLVQALCCIGFSCQLKKDELQSFISEYYDQMVAARLPTEAKE